MASGEKDKKWYFTKEQLASSPSRKCGIDPDKELSYRQQAANFIQDMGQRLSVSQLCINTAIVYMHRFYVFHSLSQFHRNSIATAALFLAAKVEEQPRKLEHVIKVAHMCLHRDAPSLDMKSEHYLEQAQELVFNENVLLQTLGFEVAIDHPHTYVVKCCHMVKASKDLAQTSYFMASNSLHLTTMCLQYRPTVVACFCIQLACKWSNWEIPESLEGKDWFLYIDEKVTSEMLAQLTDEFLHIFDKFPSRLKRKIREKNISTGQSPNMPHAALSPFDADSRRAQSPLSIDGGSYYSGRSLPEFEGVKKSCAAQTSTSRPTMEYRDYREKKERERAVAAAAAGAAAAAAAGAAAASSSASSSTLDKHHSSSSSSSHHHKQASSSSSSGLPNKHSSSSNNPKQSAHHHNNHHHHRQDVKSSSNNPAQRHSQSSRDPNRDRQRQQQLSRDYSSTSQTSGGSVFSNNTAHDSALETAINSIAQDTSGTVHPPEKLSNHHKPERKQQPPYSSSSNPALAGLRIARKPASAAAVDSSSSSLEQQRSEEVRKLIEKPLPPPKPRAEVQKEEYAAMMLKQSHQPPTAAKYGHHQQQQQQLPDKPSTQPMPESKMLNVGQTAGFSIEKSPNAPVPASQVSQKSLAAVTAAASANKAQHQPLKNGSMDEKRPAQQQQQPPVLQAPPPVKHRSLFSPEKTPAPRESSSSSSSHSSQRAKQKQHKASPVVPQQQQHQPMPSLTSPVPMQLTPEQPQPKQRISTSSSQKQQQQQHRTSSSSNAKAADQKQQALERRFTGNFGGNSSLEQQQRAPHNLQQQQPGKDAKPTAADLLGGLDQRYKHHNGLDNAGFMKQEYVKPEYVKQEYSTIDPSGFLVKPELPDNILSNELLPSDLMFMKQESKLTDFLSYQDLKSDLLLDQPTAADMSSSLKHDSFEPLKSAQSISALLQEPLAPMPSLLQVPSYENNHHHHHHQQQQQQQSIEEDRMMLMPQEPLLPSTVDMSDLTGPIECSVEIPAAPAAVPTTVAALLLPNTLDDKQKSEHRSKGEKKKKKDKHRHKDKDKEKDKSKDKHKHRHRDKDKDKEKYHRERSDREKDNKTEEAGSGGSASAAAAGGGCSLPSGVGGSLLGTVPIKITIPKDKLNLSSESIGSSTAGGGAGSSLKIKIPKERLKASSTSTASVSSPPINSQAPLKIKIRTDALARNNNDCLQTSSSSSSQHHQSDGSGAAAATSRKRERSDGLVMQDGAPPSKKQQQPQQQYQQHQQQQRQNGRHSNDKVRGYRGYNPYHQPYARLIREQPPNYRYRRSPPPSYMLRHPPPRPYFPGYPMQQQQQQQQPRAAAALAAAFGYAPNASMYDPTVYYQYQQQFAMYPGGPGSGGAGGGMVDTSVPPPSMRQPSIKCEANMCRPPPPPPPPLPPPLPSGPPPSSSPPPPPPPE